MNSEQLKLYVLVFFIIDMLFSFFDSLSGSWITWLFWPGDRVTSEPLPHGGAFKSSSKRYNVAGSLLGNDSVWIIVWIILLEFNTTEIFAPSLRWCYGHAPSMTGVWITCATCPFELAMAVGWRHCKVHASALKQYAQTKGCPNNTSSALARSLRRTLGIQPAVPSSLPLTPLRCVGAQEVVVLEV